MSEWLRAAVVLVALANAMSAFVNYHIPANRLTAMVNAFACGWCASFAAFFP